MLMGHPEDELQRLLEGLNEANEVKELLINVTPTECVIISKERERIRCHTSVGDKISVLEKR